MCRRIAFKSIPYPSLAGPSNKEPTNLYNQILLTVTIKQAVLLTWPHCSTRLPRDASPVTQLCFALPYSGGTVPAYTGFSIKSDTQTPVLNYEINYILHL